MGWVVLAVVGTSACPAWAAGPAPERAVSRGAIAWRTGELATTHRTPTEVAASVSVMRDAGVRHLVVQFDEPLDAASRRQVESAGLRLLNYVGDNAFFAALPGAPLDAAALASVPTLRDAQMVRPEWKLHPAYGRGEIPEWAIVPSAKDGDPAASGKEVIVAAYVLFHRDVVLEPDGAQVCLGHGAVIRSSLRSVNGLVIELPLANVATLAAEDVVQWLEPPLPKLGEVNNDNRLRTGADVVQAPPYELTGAGVTVLVYDGGTADPTHPDLVDRVHARDASGQIHHATHVSGTVGGTGIASGGAYRGMAPGVIIESYGFEQEGGLHAGFLYTDPGDLEHDYAEAINLYGADVANNSIGSNVERNNFDCEWQGDYGVTDTVIDTIVRGDGGNPLFAAPFRVVWANGNERVAGRCDVEGYGAYYSIAPPAGAKNHITVGALNSNDDTVTYFTSWGPTDDGRLKPDVSAPGCQTSDDMGVTSCAAGGGYTTYCGTSMASPTVCGLSALLLEDFRNRFPGEPDPRNSTLKILLAHTAADIMNPGPDYQSGYGSVRIQPAIDFLRSGQFLEDQAEQDDLVQVLVVVQPGDLQLKVTLAWDDVPGTPNVSPALVNDLDLRVYDAVNNVYYPWTLNPTDPGAPASRTQADHLNNIEQVVIDDPSPGAYRVEVYGYSVPEGPQAFSLCASPTLVTCSRQGLITLDRTAYPCEGAAGVNVVDCDLNTDPLLTETVLVTIASTSEPLGETVLLTETGPATAAFVGTVSLSATDGSGVLLVAPGDTVTATYIDADDGLGGVNVVVTTVAPVDCVAPLVFAVQAAEVLPRAATITLQTDEPARACVLYGTDCELLTQETCASGYHTSHSVRLAGLHDDTLYYYAVTAMDVAGNPTLDDAGGACYSFMTPDVPDFFTEQFGSNNDLGYSSILWAPNGSPDFYAACGTPIGLLPVDPTGGAELTLADDDYEQITLDGGVTVSLYGVTYNTFFVGGNGYITFGSGDTDQSETLAEHFAKPRVAALYDDLVPGGGCVSWKQLADRVAVTWEDVPQYGSGDYNTFQIELFFDGRLRVSYLGIDALDGLAGVSSGAGLSPDFLPTDLSAAAACGPRPPYVHGGEHDTLPDTPLTLALGGDDDGLPDPPGALLYTVTALPTYELRDAGNDHVITPADLPYTLADGGNEVTYTPADGFLGQDGFTFLADDGGSPPTGGDSGTGTVVIHVREPVPDYFTHEYGWLEYFDVTYRSVTYQPNGSADFYTVCVAPITALPVDPAGGTPLVLGDQDYQQINIRNGKRVWLYGVSYDTFFISSNGYVSFTAGDFAGYMSLTNHFSLPRITGVSDDLEPNAMDPNISWKQLDDRVVVTYDEVWEWWFFGGGPSTFQMEMFFDGRIRVSFLGIGASWGIVGLSAGAGIPPDFEETIFARLGCQPAPPRAYDVTVATALNTAVTVDLHGEDDGLPDPPGALDYIILTLPFGGVLSDPEAGGITTVPYTLANHGSRADYVPDTGFGGADVFNYKVNDGGVPFDGGDSNVAVATVYVSEPRLIYNFPMNEDPGWTTEGSWQFGLPLGQGSHNHDPAAGYTGANVYGYNLAGDYQNNLPATYLTTTAIDCSQLGATELRFRRWLGLDTAWFDHACIEVSNDAANWTTIWEHTGVAISESAWSLHSFDISAVADGQPTVYVRWAMGPTNVSVTYPGWNLDDVEIWALAPSTTPGDLDGDGDVDVNDFVLFADCLSGPGVAYPEGCADADFDEDGDVDLVDVAAFQAAFTGGA
ncbi:MAG TPA: S8 family serine peptidase [Phycisphaerae bacterium]|nr:S8 family serine peptidase [Phycisphaerae bacterium]